MMGQCFSREQAVSYLHSAIKTAYDKIIDALIHF